MCDRVFKKRKHTHTRGFIALLTIVIVSSAALLMSFSSAFLGLGELELGYTAQKGGAVRTLAEGCLELSLQRLKIDTGYEGELITNESGSCRIDVSGNGSNRTITVEGSVEDTYYRDLTVSVTLSGPTYPTITITNWDEGG